MAEVWDLGLHLPQAGLRVSVAQPGAIAEPMGDRGVRVKWPAAGRREVRVSVEDTLADNSLGHLLNVGGTFGTEIVANGEFDDGAGKLYVHRQADMRRHVIVATRPLRKNQIVQISMEAGADGVEVADEFSMIERLYETIGSAKVEPDGATVVCSQASPEHRIRFDLPADAYFGQWAYGMAQLRRHGASDPGRMAFGALAADGLDACEAALAAVAADPGLKDAEVYVDDGTAVVSARLVDKRGLAAALLAGAQPLGRGVALILATLFLDGDDEPAVEDILTHAADSATTFGRARKPRAPSDAIPVLERIDSFRHRVAA